MSNEAWNEKGQPMYGLPCPVHLCTMDYKGFVAFIEVDERNRCFVGCVNGMMYAICRGNSYNEIEKSFHNVVDEYMNKVDEKSEEIAETFKRMERKYG